MTYARYPADGRTLTYRGRGREWEEKRDEERRKERGTRDVRLVKMTSLGFGFGFTN